MSLDLAGGTSPLLSAVSTVASRRQRMTPAPAGDPRRRELAVLSALAEACLLHVAGRSELVRRDALCTLLRAVSGLSRAHLRLLRTDEAARDQNRRLRYRGCIDGAGVAALIDSGRAAFVLDMDTDLVVSLTAPPQSVLVHDLFVALRLVAGLAVLHADACAHASARPWLLAAVQLCRSLRAGAAPVSATAAALRVLRLESEHLADVSLELTCVPVPEPDDGGTPAEVVRLQVDGQPHACTTMPVALQLRFGALRLLAAAAPSPQELRGLALLADILALALLQRSPHVAGGVAGL